MTGIEHQPNPNFPEPTVERIIPARDWRYYPAVHSALVRNGLKAPNFRSGDTRSTYVRVLIEEGDFPEFDAILDKAISAHKDLEKFPRGMNDLNRRSAVEVGIEMSARVLAWQIARSRDPQPNQQS